MATIPPEHLAKETNPAAEPEPSIRTCVGAGAGSTFRVPYLPKRKPTRREDAHRAVRSGLTRSEAPKRQASGGAAGCGVPGRAELPRHAVGSLRRLERGGVGGEWAEGGTRRWFPREQEGRKGIGHHTTDRFPMTPEYICLTPWHMSPTPAIHLKRSGFVTPVWG